jgi:hypothetical protein
MPLRLIPKSEAPPKLGRSAAPNRSQKFGTARLLRRPRDPFKRETAADNGSWF